ncbi:adenosine kinase isoform X1 [Leguminivora glycinivorella]|uniref:adenosine kinase isoform X1 n=1 Tax=Leguminivora glycinivorella TaxID=1035111 RepID=UPI00200E0E83|nr:adenosine kinase isoform X1 [Leguminivora glycinivorella]XP_047992003.1 adenosine kinase isoform X1 [Leguminivora glycinivorella]XP_047992004.1 adenosine kinase isoform X1 [Leguminivora glycinivorella]
MNTSDCTCDEGLLVGIGNPLLDISASVDDALLAKYDMKPDDAIMAEEKHMPLYKELMENSQEPSGKTYNAEFIAGGSVQNTLRVAQWILKKPHICTYFGCVGNDDYSKILEKRAVSEGVIVKYQVTDEVPTGTCAVLVTDTHRSLCANLAAAQKFTPDHLAKDECQELIKKAKYFYTSGFFVAVSPESILQLADRANKGGHAFIMNLSAPFVSQFYKEPLEKILPYVDVLFGNESEAEAFATAFGITEKDLQAIALKIANMPKLNPSRPRVVVITQGCEPVILVENEKITLVPVNKLSREQIIDTNGAGDAFAGGFLSQMVLEKDYTTCVKCGIYAATHVIQQSGCTLNGVSDFKSS